MVISSMHGKYAEYIKNLLEDIAKLPNEQFTRVVQAVQERDVLDLAVVYTAAVTRLSSLWLIWEDYCRESVSKPICAEIKEIVEHAGRGMGVVTFFNGEIKTLVVKLFHDLSPGIFVPGWVLAYSVRLGRPLASKLRELGIEEQAARLPGFVASFYVLDAMEKAMLDYYSSKGSDFAYATAGYIYWEIIKPCTLLPEVFAEGIGSTTGLPQLHYRVYIEVQESLLRDDTQPPKIDYVEYIGQALKEAKEALMEELKRKRFRLNKNT